MECNFDRSPPLTPQEIDEAFHHWRRRHPSREVDLAVEPFLDIRADQYAWLRDAREALGLTGREMARKLKISTSAYSRLERSEHKTSIRRLKAVAQAMDCELIYAIRPKSRTSFLRRLWPALYPPLLEDPHVHRGVGPQRVRRLAARVPFKKTRESRSAYDDTLYPGRF